MAAPEVLSLDEILARFDPIFRRANQLFSGSSAPSQEDVEKLGNDTVDLDQYCHGWAVRQSERWTPRKIGSITEEQARAAYDGISRPGDIDSYFDCMSCPA